jgi:hypothetical protein
MKRLVIIAAAFTTILAGATAQAAMLSAPALGNSAPNIQLAGVVCGPGFHLNGLVCVRSAVAPVRVKVCPVGWHLGPEGARCRRN